MLIILWFMALKWNNDYCRSDKTPISSSSTRLITRDAIKHLHIRNSAMFYGALYSNLSRIMIH